MARGRKKKEVPEEEGITDNVFEDESSEEYPEQDIDESDGGDLK